MYVIDHQRDARLAANAYQPLDLGKPLVFREERYDPSFDLEEPPRNSRVIDSHTREIDATDPIDLMRKLYNYSPDWKPFEAQG